MNLQQETAEKLDRWMNSRSTWHTRHPSDMDRWYDFVYSYSQNEGYCLDESELQEYIAANLNIAMGDSMLFDEIVHRVGLAVEILDFMKRVGI